MSTQPQPINRPISGVLFGITHDTDGNLIIKEPKILKVGIGLPKGPAIDVWIAPDGKWKVRLGAKDAKTATFSARAAAEAKFNEALPNAPACNYPRKIGYFTFTKPIINEAGKEQFVPDFDAIEAHGPTPTEIDIVLLDDQPFSGAYQMWSSSELLCKGDGVNALRALKLAATPEEKELAQDLVKIGERYFPIDNCWTGTCPYSKETIRDGKPQPSACKPGGDLKFQLASNIRVGGTAYFHTTGIRSISSIFSSLHRISMLTGGRLMGIPVKMVLRPFRTNHSGQSATQYAVALEFRAPDAITLRKKLLENVFEFREAAGIDAPRQHVRMIEAPVTETPAADDDEDPPIGAAAMAAEFYPDADDTSEPEPAASAPPAAIATQEKTTGLADKLKASAVKSQPTAPPVPAAAPQPAQQPEPQPIGAPTPVPEDMF